jgi:hypothetical protein
MADSPVTPARRSFLGPLKVLRPRSAFVICLGIVLILIGCGRGAIAGGVAIGYGLYVLNGFLLIEGGRWLLTRGERRRGRGAAAAGSAGRLLLLGLLLACVGLLVGREILIGACCGLLVTQLNLHFPLSRSTEAI